MAHKTGLTGLKNGFEVLWCIVTYRHFMIHVCAKIVCNEQMLTVSSHITDQFLLRCEFMDVVSLLVGN